MTESEQTRIVAWRLRILRRQCGAYASFPNRSRTVVVRAAASGITPIMIHNGKQESARPGCEQ
jgi:hypothetical protein